MGWGDVISIGLGLGNMAVNAGNASTLQQMKMQQAGEALMREFQSMLRNGIFNLNQTAEEVLRSEPAAPLKAAGAMRILDHQVSTLGLTPDLFTELTDKKFAADTTGLIRNNNGRMYAALDKDGQVQVDQLLEFIRRLSDIHYYLEKAGDVARLRSASMVDTNSAGIFQDKGCLAAIGLYLFAGLVFLMSAELGMLISLAAFIFGLVSFFKYQGKKREFEKVKKTVSELESEIDMQRFVALESQYKTPDEARQAQQRAEQYIERFFGDYTLLQDGWRA